MKPTDKWSCKECDWHGIESALLVATSPFDPEDELCGCPTCKSVDCFSRACDTEGCWLEVSCGTPTPDGYKNFCSKHIPADFFLSGPHLGGK